MNRTSDWPMFVGLLGALVEAIPRFDFTVTQARCELWWSALEDLDVDDVRRAFGRLIQEFTRSTAPGPGDLRPYALEFRDRRRTQQETAGAMRLIEGGRDFSRDPRYFDVMPGSGHFAGQCRPKCSVCEFERRHPRMHLHVSETIVCGDVDWSIPVAGCCAPMPGGDDR